MEPAVSTTSRPFWIAQALETDRNLAPSLNEDIAADVCIVGGGYTGLWTAIQLKQAKPDLDVVIVEADVCGAGASGRNGGCMLSWATRFFTLRRLFGESEAIRLVRCSEQAILDIEAFCGRHGIDCELRRDGTLFTATSPAQVGSSDAVIAALQSHGINSFRTLPTEEVRQRAGSRKHLEGIYSPVAATVQPGKLVRGLRRVALQLGVRLYEQTPMTQIGESRPALVRTPNGSVRANRVVIAINAWMARTFPGFERTIAIVSSDMVVTEPRPDLLYRIGLGTGISVLDSRVFVYYYRTTPDGRLMLGKGGNTFAYGGRMLPVFDRPSPYRSLLTARLAEFFPAFANVPIAASWNGASDRSVTGLPFFGRLHDHPDIFYGYGYSGNGVGPTYMGGHMLTSLVLGLDNEWTRSPLAQGHLGQFPPEPIRYIGSLIVRNAIRRKERAEDLQREPWLIDKLLSKFANAAGKSDKAT